MVIMASGTASSRHSASWGEARKTACKKIKKVQREEAKVHLWANLIKGRSGIPVSDIPSDWSILTGFVNTRELLKQMSETFQ